MRIKTTLWIAGSALLLSACNSDKTTPGYTYGERYMSSM